MELTQLEKSVLNCIATSEFNSLNGSIPRTTEESSTWLFTDELAKDNGITVNQVKGVLGSLVKKEIIMTDYDEVDDEFMVQITQDGINEFLWS